MENEDPLKQQSIAGLLSEAVADYVRKRRLRPEVLTHLEDSINENETLGYPQLKLHEGTEQRKRKN